MLVLAPELYLPLRNLAAQFHASADGLAVAERLLDLLDAPAAAAGERPTPPSPRAAPVRLEGVSFATRARGRRPRRRRPRAPAGRDGRPRRPERRRQEHASPRCSSASPSPTPARSRSAASTSRRATRRPGGAARLGAAAADALPRHGRGQHPARRPVGRRRRGAGGRAARRRRRLRPGAARGLRDDGRRRRPGAVGRRAAAARARARVPARRAARDARRADREPRPASAELVADAIERLRERAHDAR